MVGFCDGVGLKGIVMHERPIVVLDRVTKCFGQFVALKEVSLVVRPGEIHVLLGHNGAGKSTLLKLLLGLIRPTNGSVSINGLNAWDQKQGRQAREKTGVLFEENGLYLDLSAWENLQLFAKIYRLEEKGWEERANELLDVMGLKHRKDDTIENWSAGMKRKLAIIRAIQHQPNLVLLDEPTAGLDVSARNSVRNSIKKIRDEKMAIVLASQDLAEVQRVATHVTFLKNGCPLFSGEIKELFLQSGLRKFQGTVQSVSRLVKDLPKNFEIVRKDALLVGESVLVRTKEGLSDQGFSDLVEVPVDLEDIYLELEETWSRKSDVN